MKTVSRIIDALGGSPAVAAAIEALINERVPPQTVHAWGVRNSLPGWAVPPLAKLALSKGLRVTELALLGFTKRRKVPRVVPRMRRSVARAGKRAAA